MGQLPGAIVADELNAWIALDPQGWASAQAEHHARADAGQLLGPLDGMSVGVKDNIDVAGLRTTHGSGAFATAPAAVTDAEVITRLRAAGISIVGKTHMTELACGTSGLNTHLGNARNPHDPTRHPGGSSSGSAIAVATGQVPLALGSDTGGSIRIPAAACGVVGLKPTFGRVSNDGMSIGSRVLDHLGPIAVDCATAGQALAVMQRDGWPTITVDPRTTRGLRIGVLTGEFIDGCSSDVQQALTTSLAAFDSHGFSLQEIDLGLDLDEVSERANPLSRDLLGCFGAAVLADPTGFDPEVSYWLDLYRGIDDAAHAASVAEQHRLRAVVDLAMRDVDILVTPTLRSSPCTIADAPNQDRRLRAGNVDLFDMTGQPAVSIPHRQTRDGMPFGLQLIGRPGDDDLVLSVGATLAN